MTHRDFALSLAQEAGAMMLQAFRKDMTKEWKADHSPVTETDTAINRRVIEAVQQQWPKYGVLAEEESALKTDAEYVWVCDPIDGTVPFSHGMPLFTFSLALTHNGVPILGVVLDPVGKRLFVAEKDVGTTLNGSQISVNSQATLDHGLLFSGAKRPLQRALLEDLYKAHVQVGSLRGVVYEASLVAEGYALGTIFFAGTAHDLAAAKIIVEEAGGRVTNLLGEEQRYDQPILGGILTNGKIHDRILEILGKYSREDLVANLEH